MKVCSGDRSNWFVLLIQLLAAQFCTGEYRSMHVCHGEIKRLTCAPGDVLTVYEVFYQSISKNSTLCLGSKQPSVQCPILELVGEVKRNCNKKEKCFVNYESDSSDPSGMTSCQTAIVLKVTYECEKRNDIDGPPPRLFNNVNFPNNKDSSVTPTASSNSTSDGNVTASKTSGLVPLVLQLLYYFLDTRLIIKRVRAKPRGFLLAVTLSMAGGILILAMFCCLVFLCAKCRKTKDKVDMEDAQPAVEVSSPVVQTSIPVAYDTVVVTTSNGSTSTQTTLNREGTLNKKPKTTSNHELISSVRRSHSIDEGTQTDNESELQGNSSKHSGSLSHEEAQELGYLVDVMKYYNSRLDDEFFSDTSATNSRNNDGSFFFKTEIKNPPLKTSPLNKQISFTSTSTNRYMGDEELSSSDEKFKTLPRNTPGKFPTLDRKNNFDLDFYSPESIFNGDTLKFSTIPRTPKLGIRGDGYDVIMSSDAPSSSFK